MENSSKALLIAAAVLVALVLIALGIAVLGTGSETTEKAGAVGEQLTTSTDSYVDKITEGLSNL